MELDIFFILLIINLICGLIGLIIMLNRRDKTKGMLLLLFFLVCPLIGPLVCILAWLSCRLFYKKCYEILNYNLQSESKERLTAPDFDKAINVVPMEEAILISDKESKRRVILDILMEDYDNSLKAISEALEDNDIDISHYAAAVISEIKADFKTTVQKLKENLMESPEDLETLCMLIDYLHSFITKDVLDDIEKRTYINLYNNLMKKLYKLNKEAITAIMYKNIIYHLLAIKKRDMAFYWCELAIKEYPDILDSYKGLLKYYYETGEMNSFLEVLSKLKYSDIEFDNEILEVVRFYNI